MASRQDSTPAPNFQNVTRRAFLQKSAAGVATAAALIAPTVAVARIIGAADQPYTSEKFRKPGWYVFGKEGVHGKRVMYASEPTRWGFIPLSDGPDEEVLIEMSPRGFDRTCIWIMEPVPAGRV